MLQTTSILTKYPQLPLKCLVLIGPTVSVWCLDKYIQLQQQQQQNKKITKKGGGGEGSIIKKGKNT